MPDTQWRPFSSYWLIFTRFFLISTRQNMICGRLLTTYTNKTRLLKLDLCLETAKTNHVFPEKCANVMTKTFLNANM